MSDSGRRLLKATALNTVSRLLGFPITLLISALLARELPRADFAFFGALNSLSVFAALFILFGYQTSIVRILAELGTGEQRDRRATAFTAALLLAIVLGILFLIGFTAFGAQLLPEIGTLDEALLLFAGLFVVTRAVTILAAEALRGLGRVGWASTLSGLGPHGGLMRAALVAAGLFALIALSGLDLASALQLFVAATILTALIAILLTYRETGATTAPAGVLPEIGGRAGKNLVVLSAQALQMLATATAAILIGANTVEATALAGLVAAVQVINLLNAPLTLLNGAAPAIYIELKSQGKIAEMERLMRLTASGAFLVCVAATLVLLVGGAWLFALIFGSSYSSSFPLFLLLAPGTLFSVYAGMAGRALLILGDEAAYRRISFVSALIALPLFYFASIRFGVEGLAASISLALILQNAWLMHATYRDIGARTNAYLDPREYLAIWQLLRSRIGKPIR